MSTPPPVSPWDVTTPHPPPVLDGETASISPPVPPLGWKDRVLRGLKRHEEEREGETSAEVGPVAAPAATPVKPSTNPPQSLGRYRILRELGRGGMGAVYEADDPVLGRRVALKVLLEPERVGPQARERFQVEARAAARLRHPNVVGLLEVSEDPPFLVMELVEGESLASLLRREKRLDPRHAAELLERVAEALFYAHTRAIIHRDVKPANVLIERGGRPLLGDFGLAKEVERAGAGPTATGQAMGTPAYMSPEQVKGELDKVDRRSDVWALGVTLFEALTGELPFQGPNMAAVLRAVLQEETPHPTRLRPELDRDLETICLRCLEKEPEQRYDSAGALAQDLRRWLKDEPIAARRPGLLERAGKWRRRNRGIARTLGASFAVALLLGAAGTAVFLDQLRRERDRAEASAREAREALTLLVREVEDELGDVPGERVRGARQRLLRQAVERLQALQAGRADAQAGISLDTAEAWRQIAYLALETGDSTRAVEAAGRALGTSRGLVAARPDAVVNRRSLLASLQAASDAARAQAPATAEPLLAEAVALARAIAADHPADPTSGDQLAAMLIDQGGLLRDLGRLGEARQALEEGLAIVRAAGAARANELVVLRRLTQALDLLGDVRRAQGDLAASLALAEEGVAADRKLAAFDPSSAEVQRNLAAALTRLGSLRQAKGDLAGAALAQDEALALRRRQVALDPGSLHHRRGLGSSLLERGDLHETKGELTPALAAFREAVALFRELRALDPADPLGLDHLSIALSSLAGVLRQQGDDPGAIAAAEEMVALRREFLVRAGTAKGARSGLAIGLVELGELLRFTNQPARARPLFEEALTLLRAESAAAPDDQSVRLQLVRALDELAGLLGQEKAPAAAREPLLEEALRLARECAAADPTALQARRHEAHALLLLAELGASEERLRAAERVQRELLARDPANMSDRHNLRETLEQLGWQLKERGDHASALPVLEEALGLARKLSQADATNERARAKLRKSLEMVGDVKRNLGDPDGAAAAYREAADLGGGKEAAPPREAFMALTSAGAKAFEAGEMEVAGPKYVEAIRVARLRLAADPTQVQPRRDLALVLLHLADVRFNQAAVDEGLALTLEAADVHRPLAEQLPAQYQAEHASIQEMIATARREAAVVEGEVEPATGQEALLAAQAHCQRGDHARGVAAFRQALAEEEHRADLDQRLLYRAACAASVAAAGCEAGSAPRRTFLDQGLAWLGEDLERRRAAMERAAARAPGPERDALVKALAEDFERHLERIREKDADLAALRAAPGFAELLR